MSIRKFAPTVATGLGLYGSMLASARADDLKIGIIAPMSGPAAQWGIAMATGGKILAGQYNAQGGLDVGGKKYQVVVIPYDDHYKAADAVSAYDRLVNEDGVKYIVIAAGTSTMALRQRMQDDKIVGMTSGFETAEIGPDAPYMYRMWGVPSDFYPGMYGWLADYTKSRRVVCLNPNDEMGRGMSELSVSILKKNGFDVLSSETYERSMRDFVPLLTKLLSDKPDILDIGTTAPAQAALIVRQAHELGFNGTVFSPGLSVLRELAKGAGAANAEGAIGQLSVDPANEPYEAFAAQYEKIVGQEPNEALAPYSNGINILLHAIQMSGVVGDTAKFESGWKKAFPMKAIDGDEIILDPNAMHKYGTDHQAAQYRYIGLIKSGREVVVGKFQ
jgi:branched-chain amino acid transport system substrate-binding protein